MYRLLIADDEILECQVICKIMNERFCGKLELCVAHNGREAAAYAKENKIDIALLDIEMPVQNGIAAAAEIRAIHTNCIIIFLTAYDEFSYAKRAIQLHVLDYLLKPYSREELIAVIEQAVGLLAKGDKESPGIGGAKTEERACEWYDFDEIQSNRIYMIEEEIKKYVQEHYKEDISMQDAARKLNYSEAYFSRLFKQCFDKNFTTYLKEVRISNAKKLLKDSLLSIKQVGREVGYPNPSYFIKVFKKSVGMGPTQYRNFISGRV